MLAVKRLAEMQRSSDGRGSLRKKPPPITQQQEVMSMDSPPPDGEIIQENLSLYSFNSIFNWNYLYVSFDCDTSKKINHVRVALVVCWSDRLVVHSSLFSVDSP